MSHKIIENKAGEIKLEIEVDKKKIEAVTKMVTEELGKSVKIDGFRPGKAPQAMLIKEMGDDRFWAEVIDKVVPEAYYEAVIAEKLQPVSQPQIAVKAFVPGESLKFEAVIAVLPEIKDFKYKDLKVKAKKIAVSKDDLDKSLSELQKRMTEEKVVERAAKKGDKVEIDFEGTMKALPFEGGTSKNHPLVLGSDTMIPGFEKEIEGHKAGDKFDFDITFPKDYHAANLAGQKVNFKIEVHQVSEMVEPKLDDALAAKYGFKTAPEMKEAVEKELEFQKDIEQKRITEEEILVKIIEKNKIEAPGVLVTEEVHRMIHEAEHNLSHSGLTMEQFLDMSKKTLSDLEKEMHPEAEKRVKIGLVLGEVAKAENIQVNEKAIDSEIERIISVPNAEASSDDMRAAYNTPDKRREIANTIVIRQTLEKLMEYNAV
jgi:trigger factor